MPYSSDDIDDQDWGCAWRCFQSILANFGINGIINNYNLFIFIYLYLLIFIYLYLLIFIYLYINIYNIVGFEDLFLYFGR